MKDILAVVEISRSGILDLDHYSVKSLKGFRVKGDVVCPRSELRVPGGEDNLEIAPLPEKIVHITAPGGVPAVLCTETTDPATCQSLVQLVLQRRGPERKHLLISLSCR